MRMAASAISRAPLARKFHPVYFSLYLAMHPTLQKISQKRTPILKGFSLGEVLLASFVLTVGLLSITALMASSLRNSLETRDAIIAAELAQEGIELVRNVRDNDLASGGDGFTAFNPGQKHCRRDHNDSLASLDCNGSWGSVSRYYLQYTGGLYAHTSTALTRFSRYIYVDYNPGQDESRIISFVYWGATLPPTNGTTAICTVANKCVFTEVALTAWK